MQKKSKSRAGCFKRLMGASLLFLLLLCGGVAITSLLTNRNLPTEALTAEGLSDLDKARIAEIYQLRQTLGHKAWSGWGEADIPIIVYNYAYVYLIGYEDPPAGWLKVPQREPRGNAWEELPGESIEGYAVYRALLPETGQTPQAFTVLVGERYAASLPTRPAMRAKMAEEFRGMLPDGISELLPYTVAADLFLRNSEAYVGGVLHEGFHAFQGMQAPEKFDAANWATIRHEGSYPVEDEAFRDAWQAELNLLKAAVQADDEKEAAELAGQFLAQREARRAAADLSAELIDYERQLEWLEGLAFYTELEMLRLAHSHSEYRPVEGMGEDPEFDGYQTFETRWQQEVNQIALMAGNKGNVRFYYSGMAQGVLLDRLRPGWKEEIFAEAIFLEDLLQEALK